MTGKLLRMYAFSSFEEGLEPNKTLCSSYVSGSDSTPPLDFFTFPRMVGDFSAIRKQVLASPMYDVSGLLVALLVMTSNDEQTKHVLETVQKSKALGNPDTLRLATSALLSGAGQPKFAQIMFEKDGADDIQL